MFTFQESLNILNVDIEIKRKRGAIWYKIE